MTKSKLAKAIRKVKLELDVADVEETKKGRRRRALEATTSNLTEEAPQSSADEKEAAQPETRCPTDIAATVMVEQALAGAPGLREFARTGGSAIVVEVPGPEWTTQVTDAWGRAIWDGRRRISGDRLYRLSTDTAAGDQPLWCDIRRDESSRSTGDARSSAVAVALSKGLTVCGVSSDPQKDLPADLMRVADRHVVIPRPNAQVIEKVIEAVCGELPSARFPEDLARFVSRADLDLARRPGQTADQYLDRLVALASKAVPPVPRLTLDRLHGMDEAVAWGMSLARDLADYRAGVITWKHVDRGVLLHGQPGTGKTTFAKALAGSCGVPLISGSLAKWQAAGYLNDLLKEMRRAFAEARKVAPAVLFIDELDAFSSRRRLRGHNESYDLQVINALLELLDGVDGRDGVVVIAACNDLNRLDPALLRAGRLDRTIEISLPSAASLEGIFRYHLAGELYGVDIAEAAKAAVGRTGADVERWVRLARRRARVGRRPLEFADLLGVIDRGQARVPPGLRRRSAVHEAGHAVLIALDRPGCLEYVTLATTDGIGGATTSSIDPELQAVTTKHLQIALRQMLAGRAAEEVVLGEVSGGAGGGVASDLARATLLATSCLATFGLGKNSMTWVGEVRPETLGHLFAAHPQIALQVARTLDNAYDELLQVLRPRASLLEAIAEALVERETIVGPEIEAMVAAFERTGTADCRDVERESQPPKGEC